MSRLEVSARMTIRDGKLDEFKKQAAEIIKQTKQRDAKTLRYNWFLNRDQPACEVREAYEGSEGLVEHQMHVDEALNRLFAEVAYDHAVSVYGDPSLQHGHGDSN